MDEEEDEEEEEDESPRSVCQMRTNPLRREVKSLRASPISDVAANGGGGDGRRTGGSLAAGGAIEGCGGAIGFGGGSATGTIKGQLDGAPDQ